MLIGSRDARPAAPQGSQADTASSAASVGPSLEAFPLTRKEPAEGWGGGGFPPHSLPLPRPFSFAALMMGKEAALVHGMDDEGGKIRGI